MRVPCADCRVCKSLATCVVERGAKRQRSIKSTGTNPATSANRPQGCPALTDAMIWNPPPFPPDSASRFTQHLPRDDRDHFDVARNAANKIA